MTEKMTKKEKERLQKSYNEYVEEITPAIQGLAGGQGSHLGTGGMVTKIKAAEIAMEAGIDMIIANGKHPENLYRILDGEKVGTKFRGKK